MEATPELLPELLQVFASNPFYVSLTEGPDGYDLPKLQRDWEVAATTPGRHMWAICRKPDGAAVGMVDFLDENPSDHVPWIGLLIIRGDLQGQGYGTEALQALLDHFRRDRGWTTVRIGVIASNTAALAWWQRRGFQPIGTVHRRLPAGECEIVRLERRLDTAALPRRAP
ncbi:GNAT family N-acetyltransferase [Carboxydochorda subterranea]|uniref:GNAT family N-acetyltransferase n=1 Tax=Carboxydichorda subterranea TaxID=3109565 RepID=A0ABZ1C2H5_9FIRM|nr:GNAT family N-acetyltransferase [Limnochorda sp. L945t]WRP18946.1 GNAT family N-acetyltransferase [Limnochorda sp. L945t]